MKVGDLVHCTLRMMGALVIESGVLSDIVVVRYRDGLIQPANVNYLESINESR